MYQNADTYQWDMMRLQDGAYVSGVYQRVKKKTPDTCPDTLLIHPDTTYQGRWNPRH